MTKHQNKQTINPLYILEKFLFFMKTKRLLHKGRKLAENIKGGQGMHMCTVSVWITAECSQAAAWTMNRNLLIASRAKAFLGRSTNSGSILPRAAHLKSGVIECCCCRPHSTNVLPAESSTRIKWQPTVSPPKWQGKAPLCRDSSRGPG